ncbi:MAG: sulfatase-like hydrolase/transferase [Candidatus Binatia bacterium]
MLEHTLLIVTADHGEELLEHGMFGHGFNLFNTTVHVPLVVAGPGIPAGRVVDQNVSLVDLAPTILDLVGLPPERRFGGRSLVPLLRDAAPVAPADIILQLPRNGLEWDLRLHRDGLVRGAESCWSASRASANASTSPPTPASSTRPPCPPMRPAHRPRRRDRRPRRPPAAGGTKAALDDAAKEKLRALGYATD